MTDPRAALASDAPLVHKERGSNLLLHIPIRKGDIARGFAEADVILEGDFETSWQEHAFLQPEAGVAWVDEARARDRRDGGAVAARGPPPARGDAPVARRAGDRALRRHRRGLRRARGPLDPASARARRVEAAPTRRACLEPRGVDHRPPQAPSRQRALPLGRAQRRHDHRRRGRGDRRRRRLRLHQRRGDEGGDALRLRLLRGRQHQRGWLRRLHQQHPGGRVPWLRRAPGAVRRRDHGHPSRARPRHGPCRVAAAQHLPRGQPGAIPAASTRWRQRAARPRTLHRGGQRAPELRPARRTHCEAV